MQRSSIREVAIVGGGPSGSLCGERLARGGLSVTLFDEHVAWEKPCGGGLTQKAIAAYPFLLDSPQPKKLVFAVELISSRGQRARLHLDRPIVIYSRAALNGLLLERAVAAGCRIVCARVTQVETRSERARLVAAGAAYAADFVVLAAGARNILLPETRPLRRDDLELTLGYFVPAQADVITIQFVRGFQGYVWSFPRCDHLSVGICGSLARHTSQELRRHLDEFCREEKIAVSGGRFYSHVLPSPQAHTLRGRRVVGKNWALVGDAAAWVDPITGEGLHYALRSGDLLAQALIAGRPEKYPMLVRADFSTELEIAARIARRFYSGRFLGGAVTSRMIQFARHSPTFRALLADVISGTQDYRSLKRKLWGHLGLTLTEVAQSLLRPAGAFGRDVAGGVEP